MSRKPARPDPREELAKLSDDALTVEARDARQRAEHARVSRHPRDPKAARVWHQRWKVATDLLADRGIFLDEPSENEQQSRSHRYSLVERQHVYQARVRQPGDSRVRFMCSCGVVGKWVEHYAEAEALAATHVGTAPAAPGTGASAGAATASDVVAEPPEPRSPRDPQRRKELEYTKDTRTQPYHSQEALRKGRRKSKEILSRSTRRHDHAALSLVDPENPDEEPLAPFDPRPRRHRIRQTMPLGDWVAFRQANRLLRPLTDLWREPYDPSRASRVSDALRAIVKEDGPARALLVAVIAARLKTGVTTPRVGETRPREMQAWRLARQRQWMAYYWEDDPSMHDIVLDWLRRNHAVLADSEVPELEPPAPRPVHSTNNGVRHWREKLSKDQTYWCTFTAITSAVGRHGVESLNGIDLRRRSRFALRVEADRRWWLALSAEWRASDSRSPEWVRVLSVPADLRVTLGKPLGAALEVAARWLRAVELSPSTWKETAHSFEVWYDELGEVVTEMRGPKPSWGSKRPGPKEDWPPRA